MRVFFEPVVAFLKREDGPTAVEYAVMLALIVAACAATIGQLGSMANGTFTQASVTPYKAAFGGMALSGGTDAGSLAFSGDGGSFSFSEGGAAFGGTITGQSGPNTYTFSGSGGQSGTITTTGSQVSIQGQGLTTSTFTKP